MYTLFIDTHYKDIMICLFEEKNLIDKVSLENTNSTSQNTMPLLVDLLNRNNKDISDIKRIAVVKGPGSFTGVRIGVTIAKVLAYALDIKIVSLTSIDLIGLNIDNPSYVSVLENNGAFVSYYEDKNSDIKYMKKLEYEEFKKNNKVIESYDMNYKKLIDFIDSLNEESYYEIKPLYIKNIGV